MQHVPHTRFVCWVWNTCYLSAARRISAFSECSFPWPSCQWLLRCCRPWRDMTSVLPIFVSAISVTDQMVHTLSCQVALPTCTYVMLPQRIAAQSSPPRCGVWANEFIMSSWNARSGFWACQMWNLTYLFWRSRHVMTCWTMLPCERGIWDTSWAAMVWPLPLDQDMGDMGTLLVKG